MRPKLVVLGDVVAGSLDLVGGLRVGEELVRVLENFEVFGAGDDRSRHRTR